MWGILISLYFHLPLICHRSKPDNGPTLQFAGHHRITMSPLRGARNSNMCPVALQCAEGGNEYQSPGLLLPSWNPEPCIVSY